MTATATLRNQGPTTCYVSVGLGNDFLFEDATGRIVSDQPSLSNGSGNTAIAVGPYTSRTVQWNQTGCGSSGCAPGNYSLTVHWGLSDPTPSSVPPGLYIPPGISVTATASFQLVAAP